MDVLERFHAAQRPLVVNILKIAHDHQRHTADVVFQLDLGGVDAVGQGG